MTAYQMVGANTSGRDFVVGDVHGMFDRVDQALVAVGFDLARDHLFCVGDLIDRGPQSAEVVQFLERPYVHAVCGNHEDGLLQLHAGSKRPDDEEWLDGAEWWRELSVPKRRTVVARLRQLPLVIEVPTPRGNVAFLHADVPKGMRWAEFRAVLESDPDTVRQSVLWDRRRIERADTSGVEGIGRVFVGHTPQWSGMRRYSNVYAIDTGAVFGWMGMDGHLTCVNIEAPTAGLVGLRRVGTLGVDVVKDGEAGRPFGTYARPPG